jgi:predicted nucleotidyltransferase
MRPFLEPLLARLTAGCRVHYGDRLVSLVLFGSVARGSSGPESDIDLLVVAEGLPDGRVPRAHDFSAIERSLAADLAEARRAGWAVELSPVFKTPAEVRQGSALFLDMVDDARILEDRDAFMRHALTALRGRLAALGARRIWRGNAWYWDLKPDYRPGEVFEI